MNEVASPGGGDVRSVARRIAITAVLMAGIVAGCGSLFPAVPGSSASDAPTADLHVVNTKADAISIVVNGSSIGAVRGGDVVTIPRSRLPSAPWQIEARGLDGQLLISLTQSAEELLQAASGSGSSSGTDDDGCGMIRLRVGIFFNGETDPPAGIASCGP
jgi:hypothetical protein